MLDSGFIDCQELQRFEIVNPHRTRITFEQGPVAILAVLQRFLGPFQIGDVNEGAFENRLAIGFGDETEVFQHPDRRPIFSAAT